MTPDNLPSHSPARRMIEGRGTDENTWRASSSLVDLATCDVGAWATRFRRIWLLAPHPDDEILALGGALATLSAAGANLGIVSVTDGEASHGDSTHWTRDRLAQARPAELQRGLHLLHVDAEMVRLGLPDGRVGAHRQELLEALVDRVDENDLVLATCRFDGHPDHEACGEVAALVAELTGAEVFEYPVWMWHWASPEEVIIPWHRAHSIPLDPAVIARKREAIGAFRSQIEPDGEREPVLPPHVLPRYLRPFEVVFV